ncbi:hypothetical protein G5B30_09815 [Sphingobacterium sp. SGG-5]|nr:hypothetical protein [Sphingobacterium sp. SGG-5]NGM62210.1 hypothetical protein [Sphingobacterium sp. SGG-5]
MERIAWMIEMVVSIVEVTTWNVERIAWVIEVVVSRVEVSLGTLKGLC